MGGGGSSGGSSGDQKCPSNIPVPGSSCGDSIPGGANEASCMYGSTQCNCAGQDGYDSTIGWDCRNLTPGSDGNVDVTPIVTPVSSPEFSTPITTVDADVSSAVIPAQASASGFILAELPGNSKCPPTRPSEGDECQYMNLRCGYYDNNNAPTTQTNCDCTKETGFFCRTPTPISSSF